MLQDSRVYSFLHHSKNFAVHIIDGQKIIADLVLMHNMSTSSLSYLRDTLLSSLMFIKLLKVGENLGFYLDSQVPNFKYKLELSYHGDFRTLLLPRNLESLPHHFTGLARVIKFQNNQKSPYTSIIEAKKQTTTDIINQILKQSYQNESFIQVSSLSDHAVMVSKLPQIHHSPIHHSSEETIPTTNPSEFSFSMNAEAFYQHYFDFFSHFFKTSPSQLSDIVSSFEQDQFSYLSSTVLSFECPCNRQQYLDHLKNLESSTKEELANEKTIDIQCDYCLKNYRYQAQEILI